MKTHTMMLVLSFFCAAHLFAQPKLKVVEGTSFDFGTILRGAQVERPATLKNIGTDTLVLGNVEASCGCTAAVVSSTRIPPGQQGTLLIKFNSKNFTGPVHKTVTVNSNSSDSPRLVIEFVATIVEEIGLTPQNFWFKDAQVGKQNTVTVALKNGGKDTLRVTAFRTSVPDFSLNVPSGPIAPGKTFEVVATFAPKAAIPLITDQVFLETTNPRQPTVAIPVYGNAKP